MPARCSLPGSDAFAASIGLGSIVRASALLKRRFRRIQVCRSTNGCWRRHVVCAEAVALRTGLALGRDLVALGFKLRVVASFVEGKVVRIAGLEPARVSPLPPQSSVSANSTICAEDCP